MVHIFEHLSDYERTQVLLTQQTYALFKGNFFFATAISSGMWPARPPDTNPCDFYITAY